jgi:hypothetical protein
MLLEKRRMSRLASIDLQASQNCNAVRKFQYGA